jgi:hypothetical protein
MFAAFLAYGFVWYYFERLVGGRARRDTRPRDRQPPLQVLLFSLGVWLAFGLIPVLPGLLGAEFGSSAEAVIVLLIAIAVLILGSGQWWTMYLAARYEEKPWPYIALLVVVPFCFPFYYWWRIKKGKANRLAQVVG